jgi:hypothetical protein
MALTSGNRRALAGLSRVAEQNAEADPRRFQTMYESPAKGGFLEELTALYQKHFGRFNPFNGDEAKKQAYWEPKGWARSLDEQLELLRVYLPKAWVDPEYLAQRQAEPVPAGFVRVAVPKLAYLESILRPADLESEKPWDIYEHIGVAIEHVCGEHEQKSGARFKNWRKNELGSDRVRCHEQAAIRRRTAEATVPGDVMILDVDLSNRTLGGKDKICHTPRWSREEIGLTDHLMDLSAVDVGWILILNEDRLSKYEDPAIDVTLEEYFWGGYGWVISLCWYFHDGQLRFGHGRGSYARGYFAAGVALRPGVSGN